MAEKNISTDVAILLEKAQAVVVKSGKEQETLKDLIHAFVQCGFKAKISDSQLAVVTRLAERFDATRR